MKKSNCSWCNKQLTEEQLKQNTPIPINNYSSYKLCSVEFFMVYIKLMILLMVINFPLIAFNQNQESSGYRKRSDFPVKNPTPYHGVVFAFKGDVLLMNYDNYKSLLGSYNTDSLSSIDGTGRLEIGHLVKKHYFGFHYGFSFLDGETDSLSIKIKNRQYGFNYGYNIINTWRFTVRPTVGLKWHRSRLLNTSKHNITLAQYLTDRDLDLRFNQPIGFVGIDVSYKGYGLKLHRYTSFGIYAGYVFKLLPNPRVYSRQTRLTQTRPIDINSLSGGIYVATNLDIYTRITKKSSKSNW
jgi:hypothetical protein